jgi:predicted dinucleotide-binding enzyme
MNIAILGTGMVGNTLASKLVQLGHQITMGSRTAGSAAGQEWLRSVGGKGRIGTFAEAAAAGEIVIDCTNGANAIEALRQAGAANLRDKILIQVGNPLDLSKGMPPSFTICNTDSLGEQTQREFPEVRVVKALNTVNCGVMIDPGGLQGPHELFICGNDAKAKADVATWLCEWFGWKREGIVDLGDITNARGTEMYLALWLRLWGVIGTPLFNIHIARAG